LWPALAFLEFWGNFFSSLLILFVRFLRSVLKGQKDDLKWDDDICCYRALNNGPIVRNFVPFLRISGREIKGKRAK